MSDQEKSHAGSWLYTLLVVLLLLSPLLYLLSMGPVVAICMQMGAFEDKVQSFYAPVIWLHHNTPLKTPLERYAALWGWR